MAWGGHYNLPSEIGSFAERFEPELKRAIANRMSRVGFPEEMNGQVPGDPGAEQAGYMTREIALYRHRNAPRQAPDTSLRISDRARQILWEYRAAQGLE